MTQAGPIQKGEFGAESGHRSDGDLAPIPAVPGSSVFCTRGGQQPEIDGEILAAGLHACGHSTRQIRKGGKVVWEFPAADTFSPRVWMLPHLRANAPCLRNRAVEIVIVIICSNGGPFGQVCMPPFLWKFAMPFPVQKKQLRQ